MDWDLEGPGAMCRKVDEVGVSEEDVVDLFMVRVYSLDCDAMIALNEVFGVCRKVDEGVGGMVVGIVLLVDVESAILLLEFENSFQVEIHSMSMSKLSEVVGNCRKVDGVGSLEDIVDSFMVGIVDSVVCDAVTALNEVFGDCRTKASNVSMLEDDDTEISVVFGEVFIAEKSRY